ncbi:MAG: ABC transporter permease [Comamonadaceae bacterium]|nr:ABC transporter permease [Comamonadaceae bacterium]
MMPRQCGQLAADLDAEAAAVLFIGTVQGLVVQSHALPRRGGHAVRRPPHLSTADPRAARRSPMTALSRRGLLLGAFALLFLSGFVWVVATQGPLGSGPGDRGQGRRNDACHARCSASERSRRGAAMPIGPTVAGRVAAGAGRPGRRRDGRPVAGRDGSGRSRRAPGWRCGAAAARAPDLRRDRRRPRSRRRPAARVSPQASSERVRRPAARRASSSQEAADAKSHEAAAADAGRGGRGGGAGRRAAEEAAPRPVRSRGTGQQPAPTCALVSPVDGVVAARLAEPGSTVVAGSGGAAGSIDPATLWVQGARRPGPLGGLGAGTVRRHRAALAPRRSCRQGGRARRAAERRGDRGAHRATWRSTPLPAGVSLGELAEVTLHAAGRSPTRAGRCRAAAVQAAGQGERRAGGSTAAARSFTPVHLGRSTAWTGRCRSLERPEGRATEVIVHSDEGRSRPARASRSSMPLVGGGADDQPRPAATSCTPGASSCSPASGLGLLIGVTLTDGRRLPRHGGRRAGAARQQRRRPVGGAAGHARARMPSRPACATTSIAASLGLPGVAQAANVTYLTMQVAARRRATCARWWSASSPGSRASPAYLVAGRPHHPQPLRGGGRRARPASQLGDRIRIRRHDYTVVGLTRRMVSSGGDPMVFIPLKDAQEAQFLKDNDAIVNERARTAANPALQPPRRAGPAGGGRRPRRPATATSTPCWCRSRRAPTPRRWPRRSAAGSTCRPTRARRWRRSWSPS